MRKEADKDAKLSFGWTFSCVDGRGGDDVIMNHEPEKKSM